MLLTVPKKNRLESTPQLGKANPRYAGDDWQALAAIKALSKAHPSKSCLAFASNRRKRFLFSSSWRLSLDFFLSFFPQNDGPWEFHFYYDEAVDFVLISFFRKEYWPLPFSLPHEVLKRMIDEPECQSPVASWCGQPARKYFDQTAGAFSCEITNERRLRPAGFWESLNNLYSNNFNRHQEATSTTFKGSVVPAGKTENPPQGRLCEILLRRSFLLQSFQAKLVRVLHTSVWLHTILDKKIKGQWRNVRCWARLWVKKCRVPKNKTLVRSSEKCSPKAAVRFGLSFLTHSQVVFRSWVARSECWLGCKRQPGMWGLWALAPKHEASKDPTTRA